MRAQDFIPSAPGQLIALNDKNAVAFEPSPLPPDLVFTTELTRLLEEAGAAIGRLDGNAQLLRNPYMLIQPFVRREAVASSRIEGTTAVLEDILRFEAGSEESHPTDDVGEVINYLRALHYGFDRPEDREFSLGFLKELHRLLLDDVRGNERNPGEFRRIQVVIGRPGATAETARFVPPPPALVPGLLEDFMKWLKDDDELPKLVRLALMHYQFETIHPFEDGNGRLGRVLISVHLREWGLMEHPMLYLSEYFEQYRSEYMDRLLAVSQKGEWIEWIVFFLEAVRYQAIDALSAIKRLLSYLDDLRTTYQGQRTPTHFFSVVEALFERPMVSVPRLAESLGIRQEQVQRPLDRLLADGVIQEITGQKRNRIFVSPVILAHLQRGVVE